MMTPSHEYRERVRYACRVFRRPEHEALLDGVPISNLRLTDLEALYELVMDADPRDLAPSNLIRRKKL